MPPVFDRGEMNELDPARRQRICKALQVYLQTDDLSQGNKTVPQGDLDAAARAMEVLLHDRCAAAKITFVKLLFADGLTIAEAAQKVYISYSTAKRWKRQIIELTDSYMQPLPPLGTYL